MLNEKRVKHMIKIASYEQKTGEEDQKINTYFKNDYVTMNVVISLLWVTVGYIAMVALVFLTNMKKMVENLKLSTLITFASGALIGYIIIMIVYGVVSANYYRKKYVRAKKNTKRLARDLQVLEKMYEREEM